MLDLVEQAAEALESFAVSSDEFEDWITDEGNLNKIIPLFVRYMERMGESMRSAT